MTTKLSVLCSELPSEFIQYFEYVRSIKFDEKPDYEFCRTLFKKIAQQNGIGYDFKFDWC